MRMPKVITLTFDEDLHATDPALANFTVTIGDQSYSGVTTFIASTVTDATNAELLLVGSRWLPMVAPIAADLKCTDDSIAAVIWMMLRATDLVTQFTTLVDVSGSSTANAATVAITGAALS